MIGAYVVVFSLICLWKYANFGYNALDLAIINQTFYNSSQGQLFGLSIHPPSYLGDHFSPILILLLPFYSLWPQPPVLLILQTLLLALSAWPLFLLARKNLTERWSLFVALAWLLSPFVQNANLYEFSFLPLAAFLIFWALYYYQQKNFLAFMTFIGLALLVREDVPLIILMFSVLALIERRSKKWLIWPALISVGWFILATVIIDAVTPTGSYKFLAYYSWLGASLPEMLTNFFIKPWLVIAHLITLDNLIFLLAMLLPFGFIFFEARYLLLGMLIFLQLVLVGSDNSVIILKTHYSILLLPALFMAYLSGLAKFFKGLPAKLPRLKLFLRKERPLFVIIIFITLIYSCLTLGPLPTIAHSLLLTNKDGEWNKLKVQFYKSVPAASSVAASYEFLTRLSSRPWLYSLHYAFVGKKQFSDLDYQLPTDTEFLLFDFADAITYAVQFPGSQQWDKLYQAGDDNFRKLIDNRYGITRIADTLVIMQQDAGSKIKLFQINPNLDEITHQQPVNLNDQITFLGWSKPDLPDNEAVNLLPITLYFQAEQKMDKDFQLKLLIKDKSGQIVRQKYYALAYGLYPTSEWPTKATIKVNYWFFIPQNIAGAATDLEIQLVAIKGFLELDGQRSAVPTITEEELIGPSITLPIFKMNYPTTRWRGISPAIKMGSSSVANFSLLH